MPLTFDHYQQLAAETAIYPTLGHPVVYPALGLQGEAGEIAEKVKKMCRDNNCEMSEEIREGIKKEIGDNLWYLAEIARRCGLSLEDCAWANYFKLKDRSERGKLQGSGDDR